MTTFYLFDRSAVNKYAASEGAFTDFAIVTLVNTQNQLVGALATGTEDALLKALKATPLKAEKDWPKWANPTDTEAVYKAWKDAAEKAAKQ